MNSAETALHADLTSHSPDALYRAMSFIARHGGPQMVGPVDDFSNLVAHRAAMLAWLRAQQHGSTSVNAYLEYREAWSPVFKD